MSSHYVVVDGSNIATEGRSLPSLRQLDEPSGPSWPSIPPTS
ncbi:MAG: hypothetical protein ACXWBN_16975 [Acidimicrobiales bacterium]